MKARVVICGNKRGLPMCCYVGRKGFLTYDHDHAHRFQDAKDAAADLEYFRKTYPTYQFAIESVHDGRKR
jgi:hypothetical protein